MTEKLFTGTLNKNQKSKNQYPNVCFDLDFIAKKNAFVRTGSFLKRYEIEITEKHLGSQRYIGLHYLVTKSE